MSEQSNSESARPNSYISKQPFENDVEASFADEVRTRVAKYAMYLQADDLEAEANKLQGEARQLRETATRNRGHAMGVARSTIHKAWQEGIYPPRTLLGYCIDFDAARVQPEPLSYDKEEALSVFDSLVVGEPVISIISSSMWETGIIVSPAKLEVDPYASALININLHDVAANRSKELRNPPDNLSRHLVVGRATIQAFIDNDPLDDGTRKRARDRHMLGSNASLSRHGLNGLQALNGEGARFDLTKLITEIAKAEAARL